MEAVAGSLYLKIDGEQYDLRGDIKISPVNVQREGIVGLDGPHGFKETPVLPYIEAMITDGAGLSLQDLMALTNSTVTAELKNGKTYILREGFTTTAIELDGDEGQFSLRFEGPQMEELTA